MLNQPAALDLWQKTFVLQLLSALMDLASNSAAMEDSLAFAFLAREYLSNSFRWTLGAIDFRGLASITSSQDSQLALIETELGRAAKFSTVRWSGMWQLQL